MNGVDFYILLGKAIDMLRLEQLMYLRMVVRLNSIKLAAETLNVVPSTISTALHKMEDEIGVPLLVRTYRGIEVTEAAREIAQKAEDVAASMREIDDIISKYKENLQQSQNEDNFFRLFCSRGFYQGNLDLILGRCEQAGLEVECPDISRGNETYLEIVNQDVDAVLINHFVELAADLIQEYKNVSYIRVNTSKPYVICSERCSVIPADKKEFKPEEVIKLPHLMFTEGYDRALPIYEMLEQYGPLNVIGKYSNINVLSALLYRGKGVSVSTAILEADEFSDRIGVGMRLIPIRCDMKLSLMVCYNRNITKEKRKMLDKLIPVFFGQ